MLLRSVHRTRFEYPWPSSDSHNEVRLEPLSDGSQRLLEFKLTVEPVAKIFNFTVPGGRVHHFNVQGAHSSLEIVAESLVETLISNPYDELNLLLPDWDAYFDPAFRLANIEFLTPSPYVSDHPGCREIAERIKKRTEASVASTVIDLSGEINYLLSYDPDATHVHSTLDEVIEGRAGVCQDFAHLMIGCCRSIGIPARYVSGFLYVANSESGLRGDHATHAWVDVLLPNGRWLGIDPTNQILANDHHIRLHTGRDYSEVTPTRGVYRGGQSTSLTVSVDVASVA